MIQLTTKADKHGSYVQVMDSFTNLGPIIDMAVVDLERQGQGQVCSASSLTRPGVKCEFPHKARCEVPVPS